MDSQPQLSSLVYEFSVEFVTRLVLLICSTQEEDPSDENKNNKEYLKVIGVQTYEILDCKTHHKNVTKEISSWHYTRSWDNR